MDHLALPKSPTFPPPRVPYVCNEPFDGEDFLTYPARFISRTLQPNNEIDSRLAPNAAFQWVVTVLPSEGRLPFWWIEYQKPSDDAELAAFFQSWIFFGLLHEALAPYGLFDAKDYIGADEEGCYVHTRCLPARLQAWVEKVQSLEHNDKASLKTRLMQCLRLAFNALRCLHQPDDEPELGHPNFNRAIRTSLISVCETISAVGDMTLDVLLDEDWLLFDLFATFNDAEKARMRRSGWCPSLIASAEKDFSSVAAHFYLHHMRQPSIGVDHRNCNVSCCERLQINIETYSPRHVNESCDCGALGPELSQVAECLDRGTFPVLDIAGNTIDEVSLKVLPFEPGTPYVALSHVWVDGLGNPAAIALPRCQLLRLRHLIEKLDGCTYSWLAGGERRTEERKLYLWCDSLLCPTEERLPYELDYDEDDFEQFNQLPHIKRSKHLKNAAMAKLRDVYENASYVLVLDRALEFVSVAENGTLEVAIRLMTSRWMQRLWTYQEAALPEKLLIQVADQAVDLRDLALETRTLYRTDPVLRSLCKEIVNSCVSLRSLSYLRESGGPDLLRFQMSVRHRRVSQAKDEPICASTILGLDTGKVDKATTRDARMEVFWRLLFQSSGGIPDDIIFNEFPRLLTPGYRWAPSTFQQDLSQPLRILTNPFISKRAELTKSGLEVLRPGWRIRAESPPWATSGKADWERLGGDIDMLHVKDQNGKWYSVSKSDRAHANPENSIWNLISRMRTIEWYIIIDTLQDAEKGRQALLGFMQFSETGEQVFCSQLFVTVRLVQPYWTTIMNAAGDHATELKQLSTFRCYQLCCAWDMILANILAWFPTFASRPVWMLSERTTGRWAKFHFRRVLTQFVSRGNVASQSPEVANAMKACSMSLQPGETISIIGHVGVQFMGHFATVTQSFDSSCKWVVN